MVTNELRLFVSQLRSENKTDQDITILLKSKGWSDTDVTDVLWVTYVPPDAKVPSDCLGRYPIVLSESFPPNYGLIELYKDRIVFKDPSMVGPHDPSGPAVLILLSNIHDISIKLNWQLGYKIYITYDQGSVIKFSYGNQLSVNLYNTVYLYQCLHELRKTNNFNINLLSKNYIQDRLPIPFMLLGIILLPCLPIILSYLNIQLHIPQGFVEMLTFLANHNLGIPVMLITMMVGGTIIGVPIGLIYVIKVRKIINTVNQTYKSTNI